LTLDWEKDPQHNKAFKSKCKRRYSSAKEGTSSLLSDSLSSVSSSSESSSNDSPTRDASSEDDFPGQKHSYWRF